MLEGSSSSTDRPDDRKAKARPNDWPGFREAWLGDTAYLRWAACDQRLLLRRGRLAPDLDEIEASQFGSADAIHKVIGHEDECAG